MECRFCAWQGCKTLTGFVKTHVQISFRKKVTTLIIACLCSFTLPSTTSIPRGTDNDDPFTESKDEEKREDNNY